MWEYFRNVETIQDDAFSGTLLQTVYYPGLVVIVGVTVLDAIVYFVLIFIYILCGFIVCTTVFEALYP